MGCVRQMDVFSVAKGVLHGKKSDLSHGAGALRLIVMKGGSGNKNVRGRGRRVQAMLAVCAVLLCYAMPLIARLPHGEESVLGAWLFSEEYIGAYRRAASCSFLLFASLPALVAFCAVKLAQPRWYLVGWLGALSVLLVLFGCHYRSGALGEDSLIYASVYLSAPLYAALAGIVGAAIGAAMQDLLCHPRRQSRGQTQ